MLKLSYLKSILDYDKETGVFTWKYRSDVSDKTNSQFAGMPAGCLIRSGYILISINGKGYLAHRLAWFYVYGYWTELIDHENGVRSDNRLVNLIKSNSYANNKNRALFKNSPSGYPGVKELKSGRFSSSISIDGKRIRIGIFDTFDEAVQARKPYERTAGFSPRHGSGVFVKKEKPEIVIPPKNKDGKLRRAKRVKNYIYLLRNDYFTKRAKLK